MRIVAESVVTGIAGDGSLTLDLLSRADAQHIPIGASIELTHACNARCSFCYLAPGADRSEELSADEWRSVLAQLARAGCLFLVLTGGEPLLRNDFFDIACHARTLGFALRILTNGMLVDAHVADRLAGLFPLSVEMSLHGASARTHERATGARGSFDTVIRATHLLRARAVPVKLKCVVTQHNARELPAIAALAGELDASHSIDSEITPRNDGNPGPKSQSASACDLAAAAETLWPDACGDNPEHRLDEAPCAAGRRVAHIGPTGFLYPCVQWTKPVGDLRACSFDDLWQRAPALLSLRNVRLRDLDACAGCERLRVCAPCPALSLLERGELSGPSPTRCRTAAIRSQAMR